MHLDFTAVRAIAALLRRAFSAALVALVAFAAHAATIWNGPPINFQKMDNVDYTLAANQDRVTPNVWITRGGVQGLINARSELFYSNDSPLDTEWAYGTTANYSTLSYKKWIDWHNKSPGSAIGMPAVVHLKTEDIYIDITMTAWSAQQGGGFAYTRSTRGATGPATVALIEYYHAGFDHYFITGIADEIIKLDNGTITGWTRTGLEFNAYPAANAGLAVVCRFFSTAFAPKSSHFYTPFASECATVKANPNWTFEGEVFYVVLPAADGSCAAGTLPVYRVYNNGQGAAPNHRYTTSLAVRQQMLNQGYIPEGLGPVGVIWCSPA